MAEPMALISSRTKPIIAPSLPPPGRPSNVAYQEVTVRPGEVALEDRHLLPNLWYSPPADVPVADLPLRLVALVATRDVAPGEELFSDYFTVVH